MKALFLILGFISCHDNSEQKNIEWKPNPQEWTTGCVLADEYNEKIEVCMFSVNLNLEEHEKRVEANTEINRFSQLVCNDGSISNCGCRNDLRGCCSHHGGVNECRSWTETKYTWNESLVTEEELIDSSIRLSMENVYATCSQEDFNLPWGWQTESGWRQATINDYRNNAADISTHLWARFTFPDTGAQLNDGNAVTKSIQKGWKDCLMETMPIGPGVPHRRR
jgi:hypothetical protein